MSNFDVRTEATQTIQSITFADEEDSVRGRTQANVLLVDCDTYDENMFKICDEDDFLYITSKEHAENLIKALNKAIELKWVV